jgi:hypothetical protein
MKLVSIPNHSRRSVDTFPEVRRKALCENSKTESLIKYGGQQASGGKAGAHSANRRRALADYASLIRPTSVAARSEDFRRADCTSIHWRNAAILDWAALASG